MGGVAASRVVVVVVLAVAVFSKGSLFSLVLFGLVNFVVRRCIVLWSARFASHSEGCELGFSSI